MSPEQTVRHPLFARLYARMAAKETAEVLEHRRQLLSGLSGRVLEVGAGSGVNFAHYPPEVDEVVAVEPEPYLRARAHDAAHSAAVRVSIIGGTAEYLPVEDESCEATVAALVLCSVPDQRRALAELRRVLRPGGELRFYEHVRSHKAAIARSQEAVDRLFWPRAFGNCHTARDTSAAIERAGFIIERQERLWAPPCPLAVPIGPHALGVARQP